MNWLSASEKEEAASCSSYAYYKMSKNASIPPNDNSTPIIEARNSAASSMVVRYLISEKGDIVVALKKLRSTLKWRKEQNIDLLRDCFESSDPLAIKFRERIRHFVGLTGKLVVSGYDKEHRACWHTIGRRSPPGTQSDHEGCMLSHFYFLERALACSEAKSLKEGWKVPQGKVIVSVDFGGFKKHHAPLMSTVKELLHGLLNHYPERLFRVYLVGPPLVFCCLWKMVAPFIDEKTKEKFQFLTKERATKVFEEAVGKDECLPYQHEKGKLSDEFDMDDFFLAIPFDECY